MSFELPKTLKRHQHLLDSVYSKFAGVRGQMDINRWILNFAPEHQLLAVKLLENLHYWNQEVVKEYCRRLYHSLQQRGIQNPCFVGWGSAAKSGAFISYYFRIANNLSSDIFFNFTDITKLANSQFDAIVFLDDFVGSGNQVVTFWTNIKHHLDGSKKTPKTIYLGLAGFESGKRNIQEKTGIVIELGYQLTDLDQAFSPTGIFDYYEAQNAKDVMEKYGTSLFPEHPLGYAKSQALVAFFYNTPNNTLPIFWSAKNNWFPLFERYEVESISSKKKLLDGMSEGDIKLHLDEKWTKSGEQYLINREAFYSFDTSIPMEIFEHLNFSSKAAIVNNDEQCLFMRPDASIIYSVFCNHTDLNQISRATKLSVEIIGHFADQLFDLLSWSNGHLTFIKPKVKTIVFDWSDTLVDEFALDEAICEFIPYTQNGSRTEYLERTLKFRETLLNLESQRSPLWYDYNYLGKMFGRSESDIRQAHLENANKIKSKLDFPRLAEKLRSEGYKVGIATNCVASILKVRSEILGWDIDKCTDFILTSDVIGKVDDKSHFFEYILKNTNISASEILVVSDHFEKDLLPAKVLGCKTFWILVNHKQRHSYWGTPGFNPSLSKYEFLRTQISERIADYYADSAKKIEILLSL